MAARKTRIKAPALAELPPQTREDCAVWIKALGDIQRELARVETEMNDAIGEITQTYQPQIDALKAKIAAKQTGIQTWAEAHREELTEGGKTKTANLITGLVQWRQRPPSVTIRGVDAVLETLERLGLSRFIRTKREPNKEAMLNEPEAVKGVAGISIVQGVEDFIVTPFEQEAV
ncbi:host-nuclease inhibitor Gam family protein [Methylocaldum sp. MU1018]